MKGHIRSRGAKSWEVKLDIGRDAVTRKRKTIYKSVRGTKKEAQGELADMIAAHRKGQLVRPTKETVGAAAEDWLTTIAPRSVSAKTLERYKELVRVHVIPEGDMMAGNLVRSLRNVILSDLQADHIDSLYSHLLAAGKRDGTGLSPRTVRHIHRVLKAVLQHAVRRRKILANPADDATPGKVEDKEVETLSPEELRKLLARAQGTKLYMPVLLAATTGMRRGEILALRWSDVDFDKAELRVEQSLEQTKDGLRFKAPKSKKSRRTITLPALTVAALRRHRASQGEERLALGISGGNDWLVFTRYDGETINPRNFTKEFGRLIKSAGVKRLTFHGLRHTHITQLLAAGEHVKVVSERAGHSDIGITLKVYSHVIPGMQEDVAKRLDASLRLVLQNDA